MKVVSDFCVAYGDENWAMRTRRQVCVVPQGQEANPGMIVLLKMRKIGAGPLHERTFKAPVAEQLLRLSCDGSARY